MRKSASSSLSTSARSAPGSRCLLTLYTKKTKDGSAGWKFITPKSETSIRDVDIPESLISLLELHRKKQNEAKLKAGERWEDHDLVFCTKFGTPLNPDNMVKRHFRKILKKAGLRQMPFHSLRHTYCSLKALDGANIQYTRQQMGHSDSRVTLKIYTHVMPIESKAEREKLDRRMRAQIGQRGENLVLQRRKAQSGMV